MRIFKKKSTPLPYDKMNKKPVIKASICNGEQVAGFKDIHTGKIEEIMLIRNEADLDTFRKMYGIEGKIEKEHRPGSLFRCDMQFKARNHLYESNCSKKL